MGGVTLSSAALYGATPAAKKRGEGRRPVTDITPAPARTGWDDIRGQVLAAFVSRNGTVHGIWIKGIPYEPVRKTTLAVADIIVAYSEHTRP